jgi:hypothetical protein
MYNIELINGYTSGSPYKFFRINNPGIGAWTYALIEDTPPDSVEPVRVYMTNESDLVLEFISDQERYYIQYDQNGNAIPVTVNLEAKLYQGGETTGLNNHTQTVGAPVDDAIVSVQVTSPDGQIVVGRLVLAGNGIYTISLETDLTGNYDLSVIASDNFSNGLLNNSQYLITTEHSFYISPFIEPTEITGKTYIQNALNLLVGIMQTYCPGNQNCSLDINTKKNINNAISYLNTALEYFESDGNHLKVNKGLSFYANITSAVNKIYSYISSQSFGDEIGDAIFNLKEGSYKIAVTARDDAEVEGACQVSNCEELLSNANSEIGKALREYEKKNYVNTFNHLTNAWKFAQNMMGANLRKEAAENEITLPVEFGLDQNYPNPFNPATKINFQLPENNYVSLKIYDILGNLVTTLVDQETEAGYYTIEWNAGNLSSGVYFYTFKSGSFVSTKKLILLK